MNIFKKNALIKITQNKTRMRKKKEWPELHERLRALIFSSSEIGDLPWKAFWLIILAGCLHIFRELIFSSDLPVSFALSSSCFEIT